MICGTACTLSWPGASNSGVVMVMVITRVSHGGSSWQRRALTLTLPEENGCLLVCLISYDDQYLLVGLNDVWFQRKSQLLEIRHAVILQKIT